FGFWVVSDSWSGNLHEVREFDFDGGDVSVVTYPAYMQTSAELRAMAKRHLAAENGYPLQRAQHRLHELELLSQL
ncbi:HK97 family phage prohead protease, partial [Microbacterium arborescens]